MTRKTSWIFIIMTVLLIVFMFSSMNGMSLFSDAPKAVKHHTPTETAIDEKPQNLIQTHHHEPASKQKASFDINQTAFVDVPVTTLWTEPGLDRPIDQVATGNPADMREWTEAMSLEEKKWLIGNLQTQALYGDAVTIKNVQGGWAEVAVHGQPAPESEEGYMAWLPVNQLVSETAYETLVETNASAVVTVPTTWLFQDQALQKRLIEISYNTKLPVIESKGNSVLIATPDDGQRWIAKDAVAIVNEDEELPQPTGEALVESGKQFLGLPYLWAGTSGFGFDCSGFTHNVYKAHGMTIPRDASAQALQGTPVAKENLQAGDLLFFADQNGQGHVHHVGMYIGNGDMIHAPNTDKTVEIIQVFQSDYWSNEYAGARRYIDGE